MFWVYPHCYRKKAESCEDQVRLFYKAVPLCIRDAESNEVECEFQILSAKKEQNLRTEVYGQKADLSLDVRRF